LCALLAPDVLLNQLNKMSKLLPILLAFLALGLLQMQLAHFHCHVCLNMGHGYVYFVDHLSLRVSGAVYVEFGAWRTGSKYFSERYGLRAVS
jgi:hypothetical protein